MLVLFGLFLAFFFVLVVLSSGVLSEEEGDLKYLVLREKIAERMVYVVPEIPNLSATVQAGRVRTAVIRGFSDKKGSSLPG